MRIVLVTEDKSPYIPGAVNTLMKGRRRDIVGIVVSSERTHSAKSLFKLAVRELRFYGFRGFMKYGFFLSRRRALGSLRHILPIKAFYSAKAVAEHYSIPLHLCQNVNEPEFLEFLSHELAPDVIVSMGTRQIFKKEILRLPEMGCINVHPSLLPGYRGPAPFFWVLACDEFETGVTVHYMDEKLDNGDIILQSKTPICSEDTVHSLSVRTMNMGAALALQVLEQMEAGTVFTIPNDGQKAAYYSFPT
ncbi:MAG: hypothetical protein MUP21_13365, partial [Dehalococcoidia bacterium]|nr:hypothetical protein [Dehalococcoidia bacterium]